MANKKKGGEIIANKTTYKVFTSNGRIHYDGGEIRMAKKILAKLKADGLHKDPEMISVKAGEE